MIRQWVMIKFAAVPIGFAEIVGMVLRRTLSDELAVALISSHKAGCPISTSLLEAHTLSNGSPTDLVNAAIVLNSADVDPDYALLGGVSRREGRGVDVAESYVAARRVYPTIEFAEVADRYMNGEDIISAAHRNELRPLSSMSGWSVRIEYGPLEPAQVAELLDRASSDVSVLLRKPGSQEWAAPARYSHLLR